MYHFIINPDASSGKGKKTWRKVKHILDSKNISYESHFLNSSEEAIAIAWRLSEPLEFTPREDEINHLIVLGGDGTLNAVVQGIRSFKRVRLSCIMTGSGNDFARDMCIDPDTKRALTNILYAPSETILDYGELTAVKADSTEEDNTISHRFIISSGIGYDANICVEANSSRLKKILNVIGIGRLIYLFVGIKQIFTNKCCKASLIIDEGEGDAPIQIRVPNLFFIVGMIHAYEGGGVPFCPNADPSDGLLDICLVERMPKWKLLMAISTVYQGKHYKFKRVRGLRGRSVDIQLDNPQWFHIDGETPCKITGLSMKCKSGLRFVK